MNEGCGWDASVCASSAPAWIKSFWTHPQSMKIWRATIVQEKLDTPLPWDKRRVTTQDICTWCDVFPVISSPCYHYMLYCNYQRAFRRSPKQFQHQLPPPNRYTFTDVLMCGMKSPSFSHREKAENRAVFCSKLHTFKKSVICLLCRSEHASILLCPTGQTLLINGKSFVHVGNKVHMKCSDLILVVQIWHQIKNKKTEKSASQMKITQTDWSVYTNHKTSWKYPIQYTGHPPKKRKKKDIFHVQNTKV